MKQQKNPHAGFSYSIFPERVRFCVGEAQTGKACLRRHANLRFARISRSRAPERKKNAIRVNSRRLAVKYSLVSTPSRTLPNLDSQPHRVSPIQRKLAVRRVGRGTRPTLAKQVDILDTKSFPCGQTEGFRVYPPDQEKSRTRTRSPPKKNSGTVRQ